MKFAMSQAILEELLMSSKSRRLMLESLEETIASEETETISADEVEIKVVNHNRTTHEDYPVKGYRHAKRRKSNMRHKESDRIRKNNSHWDYKMYSSGRINEFASSAKEKRYEAKSYFDSVEIKQMNPEDYEIYKENLNSLVLLNDAANTSSLKYEEASFELKEIEKVLKILKKRYDETLGKVEQFYYAIAEADLNVERVKADILAFEEGVRF